MGTSATGSDIDTTVDIKDFVNVVEGVLCQQRCTSDTFHFDERFQLHASANKDVTLTMAHTSNDHFSIISSNSAIPSTFHYGDSMIKYFLAYGATAIAFCALDFTWLTLVAPKFYQAQIGPLLLDRPNLLPALVFYALYVGGLVVFCVDPAMNAGEWKRALVMGALLGLVAYATYDLSNLATLKGWAASLSLVDMAWGMLASGLASTVGYFGANFLNRFTT